MITFSKIITSIHHRITRIVPNLNIVLHHQVNHGGNQVAENIGAMFHLGPANAAVPVWKYVYEYTDVTKTDVFAGVIDPKSPETEGHKELFEDYMVDYGIAVVWYAN
jgi:hypothetical protein